MNPASFNSAMSLALRLCQAAKRGEYSRATARHVLGELACARHHATYGDTRAARRCARTAGRLLGIDVVPRGMIGRAVDVAQYFVLAAGVAGAIVGTGLIIGKSSGAPRPLALGEYGRPVCVTGIAMPAKIVIELAARRCRAAGLACKMQDA